MAEAQDVSMYLIHPALRPALDEWLVSRGLVVNRTPFLDGDDPDALPTFLVSPSEETWHRATAGES